MAAATATRKTLLLAATSLLLATTAAAAPQAGLNLEDSTVWLNNDGSNLEASPACTNATEGYVTLEEENVNLTEEINDTLTTSDFQDSQGDYYSSGSYTLNLTCSDGENTTSVEQDVELKALDFEITSGGKGFFGEQMDGESRYSSPVQFRSNESLNVQLKAEDLSISSSENHVAVNQWSLESGEIKPMIKTGYDPSDREIELEFRYDDGEEAFTVVRQADVEIYPWKTSLNGESMGVRIFYDRLLEGFQYDFDVKYADFEEPLQVENFRVTVSKVGEEGPYEEYEAKKWFQVVEDDRNHYVIKLNKRPDLEEGAYTFRTFIERNGRTAPIDTVRVTNALKFSGVVRDSSGGPVKTQMLLKRQTGSNVPISTGSDGTYSATIGTSSKTADPTSFDSVELMFYDRGRSAPDSTFQLADVTLGENPDLGFSSEAIRYQYWSEAVSDVQGLQEVNMMAGKFSHDIVGGAEAFMKFDPQSVNPENLRVYECSSWNFQGRKCMSGWDEMDDNDVSIDYSTWQVHLQDLDLHEIPEDVTGGSNKTILMNAYIVGTSSRLGLKGDQPVSVGSRRVAANRDLTVSGTVVNGEGESVENARVEVSFVRDGEEYRTSNATTGPNGRFEYAAKAPSERGKYSLEIEVSKAKYRSYSVQSGQTIDVFYEKGLKMSSEGSPSLKLGETSSLVYTLSNTGQQPVENIDFSVSGLETRYFSKKSVPETLAKGESATVSVEVDLPRDYCPAPCASPPVIDVKASGSSAGEELEASKTIYTSLDREGSTGTSSGEEKQQVEGQEPSNSTSSGNSSASITDTINNMTGNFLKRQSSVNIALGLIMVFTMILALAIRKKKDDTGDGTRERGRARPVSTEGSRVSKPKVSPDEEASGQGPEPVEEEEESSGNAEEEEDEGSDEDEALEEFYDEEKEAFVCDECGEEFDTVEGLEMHREINNLD